jgi:hypothetical protein
MSGRVILLLCRVQVLGREKARHIYRCLPLPPPSPTNCRAWVAVVVAEHQVGGDKLACVTLDEQATEFVFGYSRPIHAVELHELPPVSSTTQILPFEVRSREGVLQICTHSSWPVRSLRNILTYLPVHMSSSMAFRSWAPSPPRGRLSEGRVWWCLASRFVE